MDGDTESRGNRAWVDAGAGAVAGCVARFAVGPLDVLKIRFQVQLEPHLRKGAVVLPGQLAPKYTSLGQALRTIVREEGLQVLRWLPAALVCSCNLQLLNSGRYFQDLQCIHAQSRVDLMLKRT